MIADKEADGMFYYFDNVAGTFRFVENGVTIAGT